MDYQVKITHNPAGRGCVYFEIPVVEHNPRFRLVFLPVLLSLVNNRVTHDFFPIAGDGAVVCTEGALFADIPSKV